MIKNIFTDSHTYVIVALFLVAGVGAIHAYIPASVSPFVDLVLGGIAIWLKQSNTIA